jgi:hypothetical protein
VPAETERDQLPNCQRTARPHVLTSRRSSVAWGEERNLSNHTPRSTGLFEKIIFRHFPGEK